MFLRRSVVAASCAICLALGCSALLVSAQSAPAAHVFFRVKAASSVGQALSGRLLIFMKAGSGDKEISMSEFHAPGTAETFVCAREIRDLAPGASVEVDADSIVFPRPFSEAGSGSVEAQAVLDVDHTYNYKERTPEDWVSPVVTIDAWKNGTAAEPELVLDHHPEQNPQRAAMLAKAKESATPDVARLEEFESPLLTRFWGRPTYIRAWVILPPGYADHGPGAYPTAYWTHGFGGFLDSSLGSGLRIHDRMKDGKMPPMIWVMLDESCPEGTHEFADSVNNGPWGAALTTEFIPYLEKKYWMDRKASSRLLNGHSSGGWATLQLEINYPNVFGGTWSTSPDPSDFHDFTGIDLYAPHANAYRKPDGTPYPIMRDKGQVMATFEELSRMEEVLGPYGGQIASFEWVFSPRNKSGAPEQMFDRTTGEVNPAVVAYWHDRYDLAHIVETRWAESKGDLKGRIHLYVGTADTFYLDGAAHKFDAVLARLGADAHFTYIPDRTHFDLYRVEKDPQGLFDEIGEQMWETARPGKKWKSSPTAAGGN